MKTFSLPDRKILTDLDYLTALAHMADLVDYSLITNLVSHADLTEPSEAALLGQAAVVADQRHGSRRETLEAARAESEPLDAEYVEEMAACFIQDIEDTMTKPAQEGHEQSSAPAQADGTLPRPQYQYSLDIGYRIRQLREGK